MPFFGRSMWERGLLSAGPPHMRAGIPGTRERPERHLLVKRAIMQGFLTTDFALRYEEAVAALAGWVREGKLKYREDMQEDIEAGPASIALLYAGENRGKLVIKL